MKLRIELNFSNCIKAEMILVTLIILFTILGASAAVSACFALSFIVLLIYALARASVKRYDRLPILLIVAAVLNVVINAALSGEAQISFDYFKKLIMFVAYMLLICFAADDSVTKGTTDLIRLLPFAGALISVLSYFFFGNTAKLGSVGITLGFSNPNFTGMWLLHLAIYTFLFMLSRGGQLLLQLLALVMFALLDYLIYLTGARSAMIGIAFFTLLCLIGKFPRLRIAKNRVFIALIILAPIVIVLIYRYLLNSKWFNNMFAFMVSEGKSLSSRLYIWNYSMKFFKASPILGDYCGISSGLGASQLHNTHLDVLCSYGLLPFVLFLWHNDRACRKVSAHKLSYPNYCALCGFLAVVLMGSFEAAVVSGAMGLNLLTAGLIVLANEREA